MGKALVAFITTKKNLDDLFTKVLCGQTPWFLFDQMCWGVFPTICMSWIHAAWVRLISGSHTGATLEVGVSYQIVPTGLRFTGWLL
jgi:hypothetical protein